MNFIGLFQSFLNSTDTLVQVIATLYVAVAIFAGEQISSTFNGDTVPIRLKAKHYIKYLRLKQAVICAVGLPLIAGLQQADLFSISMPDIIKPLVLVAACGILAWKLIEATFETFLQTGIHKMYSQITDPQTRLIAWALDQETDDPVEENKMIVSILSRENDYDFELRILKKLQSSLDEVLKGKDRKRAMYLVGSLRVLRRNLDKRPLEQPEYFELLFTMSHDQWLKVFQQRGVLHGHKIYQLSSTLGKIGKDLMITSLGKRSLAYDYFNHLQPFVEVSGEARREYFGQLGSNLLLEVSSSSESAMIWSEYFPKDWLITANTADESANHPAKLLYAQYCRLVNKVQRENSELTKQMDDITANLFPGIHTGLWSDLAVLRYQYWPGTTAEEHIRYWVKHPKKFGFVTYGATIDFSVKDRAMRIKKVFDDLEQATINLAARLSLFPLNELEELITACKKLQRARALTPEDLELLLSANLDELEQTLAMLRDYIKKQK
jgi:hypothetical protein